MWECEALTRSVCARMCMTNETKRNECYAEKSFSCVANPLPQSTYIHTETSVYSHSSDLIWTHISFHSQCCCWMRFSFLVHAHCHLYGHQKQKQKTTTTTKTNSICVSAQFAHAYTICETAIATTKTTLIMSITFAQNIRRRIPSDLCHKKKSVQLD